MQELTLAALAFPSFLAGILTFLAPCTLPLVPGYLAFISGVSPDDLRNPEKLKGMGLKRKVFMNGVLYVLGFSIVFILFGLLVGLGGAALLPFRIWLTRIGGIFVILFGLFLMGVIKMPAALTGEKHLKAGKWLKPGTPGSSFIFGSAFAFGWSPCVGPILGSVLILAANGNTVGEGAALLTIFAAGLAIPFLLVAAGIGHASRYIEKIMKWLNPINKIGGAFLVLMGVLLITNQLGRWTSLFFQWFGFLDYERILDLL